MAENQRTSRAACKRKYAPKHAPMRAQSAAAPRAGGRGPMLWAAGVCVLTALILAVSVWTLVRQARVYVLLDGQDEDKVYMFPGSVEAACRRFGLDEDLVAGQKQEGRTVYLTLADTFDVSIRTAEGSLTVRSLGGTVQELLDKNGVFVGPDDLVEPALDTRVTDSCEIRVTRVTYKSEFETEDIPFRIVNEDTSTLLKGEQKIAQRGQTGARTVKYRVTYHDGEEAARELVAQDIQKEPVNCIVQRGTRAPETKAERQELAAYNKKADALTGGVLAVTQPATTNSLGLSTAGREQVWSVPAGIQDNGGTITAADGSTYRYSSVIEVRATAYHRIEDGGTITASGTYTQYGTVAVDPSVIPLGSRVYVVSNGGDQSWSYGPGLAEDTGGLIKDARIDLFFMTGEEAEQFGVRPAKVYILED